MSLLNMLQYCFCFMFWFFGRKENRILAPWPGIKPTTPALEGKVLTTGSTGKSLNLIFFLTQWIMPPIFKSMLVSIWIIICLYHSILQVTRIFGLSIYMVKAEVECKKYLPTAFLSSTFIGIIAAPKCAVQKSEWFYSPEIASVIISTLPHYYGNSHSSFPSVLLSCYRSLFFFSIEYIAAFIISLTFF